MYNNRNYKKISDFYKEDGSINSKCVSYFTRREDDVVKSKNINEQYKYIAKPTYFNTGQKPIHSHQMLVNTHKNPIKESSSMEPFVKLSWNATKYDNLAQPGVWGPAFWFTLHNGSYHYDPSEGLDYMKNFVLGIPVMIPCISCRSHARKYIDEKINDLDTICANKHTLFKFFVDFHNFVNKRHNKPEMSLEDAYKLYSGAVEIETLSYK